VDIHVIGFSCHFGYFAQTAIRSNLLLILLFRIGGEVSSSRTRLKNVTHVLGQLLDDYDIRLRPDFGGK
jgi:hypothetical protein